MKTTVKFLSALLCAAALVGCTEDLGSDLDVNVDGAAASTLNVTIDSAATRVSLTDADSEISVEWKVGDKISFFDSEEAYVCDFECTNASGSFAIVGDGELSSGTYTVVYPATESLDERGQTDGTTQVQDSSIAHLEDVIYLSGTIEFDAEASNSLNMSHDIALMKISFSPETADAIPSSIQFRNGDEGTYALNFQDVSAATIYTSYMVIEPCEATSRTLTFEISYTNGDVDTYKVDTDKAYVAGTCYTAGVETLEVYLAEVNITTPTAAYCATRDTGFQIEWESNETITWASADTSIATVNASGYVTLAGAYGTGTINALVDGEVAATHTFTVPGGWWIEDFDEYIDTTYKFTAATTTNDYFLFLSQSNTNTPTKNGYITIKTENAKTGTTATIDDQSHTFDTSWRTDFWCLDEATCILNANTYKYFAVHIDNNVANNDCIPYQSIEFYCTDTSGSTIIKYTINSSNSYNDGRVTTKYFDDGSLMWIHDLSNTSNTTLTTTLTSDPDSYATLGSISFNYFMYGYSTETTVGDITYPAIEAYSYNLYSIQTFASMDDVDAYISSNGLTVVE